MSSADNFFEIKDDSGSSSGKKTTKHKQNEDKNDNRPGISTEHVIYKYSNNNTNSLFEAVLINNRGYFLEIKDGIIKLHEKIEQSEKIVFTTPQDKTSYLSKPYSFSSIEEIQDFVRRARKETVSSLFKRTKRIWRKYFDIDDDALNLCTADTLFTYFQDKLGMTHYLLFVGDNGTGKSNALRIFNHLAYRPLFDTDITPANIYNFLGRIEEGQGIILEDEIDNIEEQKEKMKIYKCGYTSGTRVTRLYESSNNPGSKRNQWRFFTFGFKAFSSERNPSFYKAKGFNERLLVITCSSGNPCYDISEVESSGGDPIFNKLKREIDDTRKLLFAYRILTYNKVIPDIRLSIRNREKQLSKPLLRLFQNSNVINQVNKSLVRFIVEKKNKKLNSLDSFLYSLLMDRCDHSNNLEIYITLPNETLWNVVSSLQGSTIPGKPHSYQTDEFGTVSKTQITKICEDKFGAKKGHDGKQRCLIFNKVILERLKDNYSPIGKVEIIYQNNSSQFSETNALNTFNTFWTFIDKNTALVKRSEPKNLNQNADLSSKNQENSPYFNDDPQKDKDLTILYDHTSYEKVLKPLKVLKQEKSSLFNESVRGNEYVICLDSKRENTFMNNNTIKFDSSIEARADVKTKQEKFLPVSYPCYFCLEYTTFIDFDMELHLIEKHKQDLLKLPIGGNTDYRIHYVIDKMKGKREYSSD